MKLRAGVLQRRHEIAEQPPAGLLGWAMMVVLQLRENVGGVHYDRAGLHQPQDGDLLVELPPGRFDALLKAALGEPVRAGEAA